MFIIATRNRAWFYYGVCRWRKVPLYTTVKKQAKKYKLKRNADKVNMNLRFDVIKA